jgi:hypothetical protein
MKIIYIFLLSVLMFSCKDDNCCDIIDFECYSFDIRQCQTDEFADEISESESQEERESLMKSWLSDKGFRVEKVKLELDFHDAVCEACHVCPMGDRYFIQVSLKGDTSNNVLAEVLELLSFEITDCSVFE